MTRQEIADEINERKLYSKKDGTPVTAFQIHGRTKKTFLRFSHVTVFGGFSRMERKTYKVT
jgi:hypothetical protein